MIKKTRLLLPRTSLRNRKVRTAYLQCCPFDTFACRLDLKHSSASLAGKVQKEAYMVFEFARIWTSCFMAVSSRVAQVVSGSRQMRVDTCCTLAWSRLISETRGLSFEADKAVAIRACRQGPLACKFK